MNIRIPFALALAGASMLLAVAPLHAAQPIDAKTTSGWSIEVWRQAKYPWLYGPRPAAEASAPAARVEPWTTEGWRRIKFPWLYAPRTAATLKLICPAQHFPPGDMRAVMAIKNPAAFASKDCE